MMTHDDHSLMGRLQAGDEQALGALLTQHWTPIVRLLGSWDKAEDVAQDAFVRLSSRPPAVPYRLQGGTIWSVRA